MQWTDPQSHKSHKGTTRLGHFQKILEHLLEHVEFQICQNFETAHSTHSTLFTLGWTLNQVTQTNVGEIQLF